MRTSILWIQLYLNTVMRIPSEFQATQTRFLWTNKESWHLNIARQDKELAADHHRQPRRSWNMTQPHPVAARMSTVVIQCEVYCPCLSLWLSEADPSGCLSMWSICVIADSCTFCVYKNNNDSNKYIITIIAPVALCVFFANTRMAVSNGRTATSHINGHGR